MVRARIGIRSVRAVTKWRRGCLLFWTQITRFSVEPASFFKSIDVSCNMNYRGGIEFIILFAQVR